jgi:predicted transcriptional regulator
MTEEETISWIFLATIMATQNEPSDTQGISMIADGINHAVPTQQELSFSFSWLIKNGLLNQTGKKYSATPKGKAIYQNATENTTYLLEAWNKLEEKIKNYA